MVNNNFVNQFFIQDNLKIFLKKQNITKINQLNTDFDNHIYYVENVLFQDEIDFLLKNMKTDQAVGIDGYFKNYNKNDLIGSYRGSLYSEFISSIIYNRINLFYPIRKDFTSSNTDHDNYNNWIFSGINPLLRFIHYKNSGFLIPHYDAPFIKNNNERTLSTMVIYLTDNEDGHTRFLKDSQLLKPIHERDFSDQFYSPEKEDILLSIKPKKGDALIFDHRLLHDSQSVNDNHKVIIRTDLLFKREI